MSLPPPLVLLLKASTPLPSLIYYCKISVALPSVQQLNYIKCCHLVFREIKHNIFKISITKGKSWIYTISILCWRRLEWMDYGKAEASLDNLVFKISSLEQALIPPAVSPRDDFPKLIWCLFNLLEPSGHWCEGSPRQSKNTGASRDCHIQKMLFK